MRRHVVVRLTVMSALGALAVAAAPDTTPDLGLSGTKHDFTLLGLSATEQCTVCHTPSSEGEPDEGALWDESAESVEPYRMFDSSRGVPGAASLFCLSCHDGSSAIDAFGGMDIGHSMNEIGGGRAVIGRDRNLTGDHPIGVVYPEFDRDYRSKVSVSANPGSSRHCVIAMSSFTVYITAPNSCELISNSLRFS